MLCSPGITIIIKRLTRHHQPDESMECGVGEVLEVARMDVVAAWPGGGPRANYDISIRSPYADHVAHAAIVPGAAAVSGERDKHRRYGSDVIPIVFESLGRLGGEALDVLKRLRRHALDIGVLEEAGQLVSIYGA